MGVPLKVKVSVAVSPALRLVLSLLMASVTGAPCRVKVTVLSVSAPSTLLLGWLPRSVNALSATLTLPAPENPALGVKTPLKTVRSTLALSLPSVPPTTVMLSALKLSLASLRVKVSKASCPAVRVVRSLLTATVGRTVSMTNASGVLACALVLPAASLNAPAATLTLASVVAALVGVKVAV